MQHFALSGSLLDPAVRFFLSGLGGRLNTLQLRSPLDLFLTPNPKILQFRYL